MATCIHGWGSDGMTPSGCPQCAEMGRQQDKEELGRLRDGMQAICDLASARIANLETNVTIASEALVDDLRQIVRLTGKRWR